ncbi:hypothetical protein BZG36_00620 [Bifiguratus adelaidae]|uniref:Uncharacterized protein n=1 Tax=Bifiguratus adelaidae TaxID=1938954 RepID=A0A261Y7Z1_9FUNG|nr:hypothetical protein BZG36_00620 [Bifiguratus adelaidae]
MSTQKARSWTLHPAHAWAIFLSIFIVPFIYRNIVFLLASPDQRMVIKNNAMMNGPPIVYLNSTDGEYIPETFVKHPILVHGGHIIPALIWALIFPLQFTNSLRRKFSAVHRWLGRIGLGISMLMGISGILMGLYKVVYVVEPQHPRQTIFKFDRITYILGAWMMLCIYYTYIYAREKKFAIHRAWALRTAAAGYSVAVMRIFIVLYTIWSEATRYEHRAEINTKQLFFGWAGWLAAVVNIFGVELYLFLYGRKPVTKQA